MSDFETLSLSLSKVRFGKRKLHGDASVFGNEIDAAVPTIMNPTAFDNALKAYGTRVPFLKEHNPELVLGLARLWKSDSALRFEAELADIPEADAAAKLIRLGAYTDVSIGFAVAKDHFATYDGTRVRFIDQVERVFELSLVLWGADSQAKISRPEDIDAWLAAAVGRLEEREFMRYVRERGYTC